MILKGNIYRLVRHKDWPKVAKESLIKSGIPAAAMSSFERSQKSPRFLVVAGPSGVGKGSLLTRLFQEFPGCYEFSISHTSRAPRSNEVHGVDYYFENKDTLLNSVNAGLFLEHAEYAGNVYGTSYQELSRIQNSGRICVLEVELKGVEQIKNSNIGSLAKYLLVAPPNFATLEERLKSRRTETEAQIHVRVKEAIEELEKAKSLGFDFLLINDDFAQAFSKMKDTLLQWFP